MHKGQNIWKSKIRAYRQKSMAKVGQGFRALNEGDIFLKLK